MLEFIKKVFTAEVMLSGWFPVLIVTIGGYLFKGFWEKKTDELKRSVDDVSEALSIQKKKESEKISERLNEFIGLLGEDITLEKIREILEIDSISNLENILNNQEVATAAFLEKFCSKLGANYTWITEGKREPFEIKGNSAELPSFFINNMKKEYDEFYLIRAEDENGHIFVVTKSENNIKYNIFPTNWLSNNPYLTKNKNSEYYTFDYYDDKDKALIANLYQTLNKNLYSSDIKFYSRILSKQDFNEVLSGKAYIGKYINNSKYQRGVNWWRDFGDMSTSEETRRSYQDECVETHEQIKLYL